MSNNISTAQPFVPPAFSGAPQGDVGAEATEAEVEHPGLQSFTAPPSVVRPQVQQQQAQPQQQYVAPQAAPPRAAYHGPTSDFTPSIPAGVSYAGPQGAVYSPPAAGVYAAPVAVYQPQPLVHTPAFAPAALGTPAAPWGTHPLSGIPYSDKSKLASGLLNIFTIPGIGRMYKGDVGVGLAQLLTAPLGIGYIWSVVDGIGMLAGNPTDNFGRPLR